MACVVFDSENKPEAEALLARNHASSASIAREKSCHVAVLGFFFLGAPKQTSADVSSPLMKEASTSTACRGFVPPQLADVDVIDFLVIDVDTHRERPREEERSTAAWP